MHLTTLLEMAAAGFGERVVVGGRDDGLTAADLLTATERAAAALAVEGADALVYLAVNGPAFPVALFAAARAGIPLVPVNYRLGEEQLANLLTRRQGAAVLAGPRQAHAVRRAGLRSRTPEEFLALARDGGPVGDLADSAGSPAPAVVIYTSGTTSEPKGVVLRHENLMSYVLSTVEFAAAAPTDAALVSVPPYHIAAVSSTLTNLYAGRRTVALEPFDPRAWTQTVQREAITTAMVVPTMLARIMDAPDLDRRMPTLRTLSYGGAPMPRRVLEQALDALPHVGFVNAYGLTETSSTVTVLGPEDHREAHASESPHRRARLSSAGRAVPGIEIEIRDDRGVAVTSGTVGRIWVRGSQVTSEYDGRPDADDRAGWFDTRDAGSLDDEGYLYIEGRIDDTIIRGAENIAPAEIEDHLLRHPAVGDAAVVGVPDDEWGQRIEAVVVARPGAALDDIAVEELRSGVRLALRSSKTPDRIQVWAELPRTDTGKLLRREIVARLTT